MVNYFGTFELAALIGAANNWSANQTFDDDILLALGTGSTARWSWDTTDANANALLLQLPAGGVVDVPVLAIGQSIESVDLGLFNGVVDPTLAVFGVGAVTTSPRLRVYKARGTIGTPTVITTGDDLFGISAYGYSGVGGYVEAASIEFDSEATVATTRVPGVIRLRTGTDAAPTVLTTALTINSAQVAILGTGEAGTVAATGNTFRAPDITTGGAGNIAGSDLTVGPGLGTGTGDVGRLIVSLPIVAAAGDNIQTRAERLAFDMVGSSTVLTIAAAQALTISTAAGDLTIDPTASLNVTLTTADADAFDLSDGTTSYYIIDTSTTVDGIFAHTFDASNTTIASGASARFGLVLLQPYTITYTGTTQVTDPNLFSTSFWIRTGTVAGDTATVTIDNRSTATFDGPTEGANVSLTTSTVLHLKDSVGTPTNSIGLRISGVVVGVTSDAQIALDFDSAPTIAAVADRVALNAAEIAAGDVRLAVQSEAGGVVYVGNDTIRAALPAAAAATNISLAADNDFQQDTSSIRYKGNVVDYELAGSALLRSLRPRSFDWLLPETPVHFLHDHGFIAEEVWEIAPYLVNLDFENKPYSLRYDLFAVPLVAGWRDHDARLTTLEDDEALFARIEQYVNSRPEARDRLRALVD